MQTGTASRNGLERWKAISNDRRYSHLAPLARVVQAVRDQSNSSEELIENAYALCEANLDIGRESLPTWQGLAVLDASSVFSLQGLGGDLCHQYGYNFWDFLRLLADLAKRSADPAQYHQCINQNLFSSPADNELVLKRLRAMEQSPVLRARGCMVDTARLLKDLVRPQDSERQERPDEQTSRQIEITPRRAPEAFGGYGRTLKLNFDGKLLVQGPYCLNVWLERPFFWLAHVDLQANWLSQSILTLQYQLNLAEDIPTRMKLLLTATAKEPSEPGRGERHFWLHDSELPIDASCGATVPMGLGHWQPLKGHPNEAYGLKCSAANPRLIDDLPVKIVLVLEADNQVATPTGSITLPSMKLVASDVHVD
jgi:hypothetical protein